MIFIEANNKEFGKDVKGIAPEAQERLLKYQWPGNVRELKNVLERAVILCNDSQLRSEHLPLELQQGAPRISKTSDFSSFTSGGDSLEDMERRHILYVLKKYDGNKSKTARVLNISRSTLREKMKNYGLM
jgi:transcriptional regulator with PAS, ATPase and Fis domain